MPNYRCPGLGDCEKANAREIFERSAGADLTCPNCGLALEEIKGRKDDGGKPPVSPMLIVAGVLLVALSGGGAFYWKHLHPRGHIETSGKLPGISPHDDETHAASAKAVDKLSSGVDAAGAEASSRRAAADEMLKVALAEMAQNKFDDAERHLDDAQQADPKQPLIPYDRGVLRLKQGRTDDALKEFKVSFDSGFSYFDEMDKDPDLQSVRTDPKFVELVSKYRPAAK